MLKLFIALFMLTATPTKVDGVWEILSTENNWLQIAMQEGDNQVFNAVFVMPTAGKVVFIPLTGTAFHSKDKISFVIRSEKYKLDEACTVSFTVIAGGVLKNDPVRFETKARIINHVDCKGKNPAMKVDDISGSWKFIRELPKKPQVPKKTMTI